MNEKQPDGSVQTHFERALGQKIMSKRRDRGFTQIDLAAEIGVHRNTLSRWEDGDGSPDVWMLLRISYVLRSNILIFLPGRELVWGSALAQAVEERDPKKGVASERDPQLAHQSAA